jgi:hypothetical protein
MLSALDSPMIGWPRVALSAIPPSAVRFGSAKSRAGLLEPPQHFIVVVVSFPRLRFGGVPARSPAGTAEEEEAGQGQETESPWTGGSTL